MKSNNSRLVIFIDLAPEAIRAVVSKADATIIYTAFNKTFVCTTDNPVALPDGKVRYILRDTDRRGDK